MLYEVITGELRALGGPHGFGLACAGSGEGAQVAAAFPVLGVAGALSIFAVVAVHLVLLGECVSRLRSSYNFV